MDDDIPSPIVSSPYLFRASVAAIPLLVIPIMVPPARFITVIIRPAVVSPFTNFVAPSMEPKNEDSS